MTEIGDRKRKVLVFCDYYLPGFKGGGPITTIKNMVSALAATVDILIVTRNHDLGERVPYPHLIDNEWHSHEGALVQYNAESKMNIRTVGALIREVGPDVIYINSVLSRRFSLLPLIAAKLLSWRTRKKFSIVLAPRGEFSSGALSLKSTQKFLYFRALRMSGLWRNIIWQASSPLEAADIRKVAGGNAKISITPDLPSRVSTTVNCRVKTPGEAVIAFVGRVSPMKNLDGALRVLKLVEGQVKLVVVGPVEDAVYWELCKIQIARLPINVEVSIRGPLSPVEVFEVLRHADVFFLPSLGENFAHVVLEALGSGCPVVLSDRTPWRGLSEAGVGFDVSLDDDAAMASALQTFVDMGGTDYTKVRNAALRFATNIVSDDTLAGKYLEMFGFGRGAHHGD